MEDHAAFLDVLVGIGKVAVLSAAHSHILYLGIVLRRRFQQRLSVLAEHKFLAALHLAVGKSVHRLFNAGGNCVLCRHHRCESGVAQHVPHMGTGVAQHGQIPPRVPLVTESGGHLLSDIPVDIAQYRVSRLLIGRLHELLRQRRIDLQFRRFLVAVPFVHFRLQIIHAALCLIKLRFRRKRLQYPCGLQRLSGASLMLHHVGQDGQRGARVAAVGCVVVQCPAHCRVFL